MQHDARRSGRRSTLQQVFGYHQNTSSPPSPEAPCDVAPRQLGEAYVGTKAGSQTVRQGARGVPGARPDLVPQRVAPYA